MLLRKGWEMRDRTIAVVAEQGGAKDLLNQWRALTSQWSFVVVPVSPPCPLEAFPATVAAIVDSRPDTAMGVAECARLRPIAKAVGLLSQVIVPPEVWRRVGASTVLNSPWGPEDSSRFFAELLAEAEASRPFVEKARFDLGAGISVDRQRRTLIVDGLETRLSAQKFELLCYLIAHAGVAVSAQELVGVGLLRRSQASRFKGLMHELRQRPRAHARAHSRGPRLRLPVRLRLRLLSVRNKRTREPLERTTDAVPGSASRTNFAGKTRRVKSSRRDRHRNFARVGSRPPKTQ